MRLKHISTQSEMLKSIYLHGPVTHFNCEIKCINEKPLSALTVVMLSWKEPGTGHPRPPWVQAPQLPGLGSVPSRGVPGASPERSEEPPGLPLPSPRLRARPRIHVRRSIVAPASSSNGLCQSEQPREQSEQEAAAGPKLQKLLLGALGLREGRAPSMQCPPCCLGTSQT